ncbi:MAG: hypothetical protein APR53_06305 [Methanoculleus sp. SDB]|nr:MAG: hypothetical protein APR53_06305 [Methanoculleus sp. SDB]
MLRNLHRRAPLISMGMELRERFFCFGHRYVTGTHRTTLEVTSETHLTPAGTCILGIGADRGAAGLGERFRKALANDRAEIFTVFAVGGESFTVNAKGSSTMTLDHPTDMVWRRSGYVCGRTVAIHADQTARSFPKSMIRSLQEGARMDVEMIVTIPDPDV